MDLRIYLYNKPVSDIKALRTEVFIKEQGFENEFDEIDNKATHVLIYDGKVPVATGRLFSEDENGEEYIIGRVCVKKEYRDKKLGKRVIMALEEDARKMGGRRVSVSAQCRVQGFYEALGYSATDDLHDDEGVPHVTMIKTIRK
ncbi:MAG: GNAT family N-acetyltransferase [Ruminococcus sp.]|nr:GNAT family N-acetyltransferase [Ruminococcus sp.]